ncbi:YxeA family protein [Paenibacillus sp. L3-i20]|uniref:YxeA family protein n=1 Tax=Paenibacillus sp. L3-i20 TaxID=2905833 RepID=UPI001EE13F7D|nr:YxeA family protein [Paenibacillus sp. L3-i20]GKU75617.1 hypothetical protein L3i20_v200140 [Paenibacillus sp. L3-i20]
MKVFGTIAVIMAALFIGFILITQNVNINRLGTELYYLEITTDGKAKTTKISANETVTSYEYNLPAFDKDGNKATYVFTSEKQLRKNAYLTLFIRDKEIVQSYQEVTVEEIPEAAASQLKNNGEGAEHND